MYHIAASIDPLILLYFRLDRIMGRWRIFTSRSHQLPVIPANHPVQQTRHTFTQICRSQPWQDRQSQKLGRYFLAFLVLHSLVWQQSQHHFFFQPSDVCAYHMYQQQINRYRRFLLSCLYWGEGLCLQMYIVLLSRDACMFISLCPLTSVILVMI